jgi:hypothetical protein
MIITQALDHFAQQAVKFCLRPGGGNARRKLGPYTFPIYAAIIGIDIVIAYECPELVKQISALFARER